MFFFERSKIYLLGNPDFFMEEMKGQLMGIIYKKDPQFPEKTGNYAGVVEKSRYGILPNSIKLGWELRKEFQGLGLMTQAVELFMQYNYPEGEIFEVQIRRDNDASIKLALRLGFEFHFEDLRKEYFFLKKDTRVSK